MEQYWPGPEDSPDELPEQYWPEPVFENPWDDYDANPLRDIYNFMAAMRKSYTKLSISMGRGVGKKAIGAQVHKAMEELGNEIRKGTVHVPAASLSFEAKGSALGVSVAKIEAQLRSVGYLPTPTVQYKQLPNGKYMPIVNRGAGPAIEPFKKRGKK